MSMKKLKEYIQTHKNEFVRIGYFAAGAIGMYVICRKSTKRDSAGYIVTDLVVGDLGKLGEHLIEHGSGTNDKVLRWSMDLAKQ